MKLTVYRQASKTRPDGTIVYKGEDARPYVGKDFLLVADGLGGASAIRHQKFNTDLFDRDKLLDTLFSGIYDDYSNEEFTSYVINSFSELFAVKDCYTENVYNIKKSGYFASRIVSAIVLHEMLYNDEVSATHLFEQIHNADDESRSVIINGIGEHFAKKIKADLCAIANKVNLVNESSYSGLALLGTTLCVAIFLENENEVETIYLTAGDSRPYFWNCDGLRQVVADQEGKDGGMTNYIRADDDGFTVSSEYFILPKPCVLFNSSDGCFDSSHFSISQLAFEKLMLTAITSSDNLDTAGGSLYTSFLEYGKHDDSSTIALKTFGYENYDQLKAAASSRLDFINDNYLALLPDLLDRDYVAEMKECENTYPQKLAAIKVKFEQEESVKKYCIKLVKSGQYAQYTSAIADIDAKIEAEYASLTEVHSNITELIANNYIQFLFAFEDEKNRRDKRAVRKIDEIEGKRQKYASDYLAQLEEYRKCFDKTTISLKALLDKIYDIGIPDNFEDFDDSGLDIINECEASMAALFDFFEKIKKKKLNVVRCISHKRNEYIEKNNRMAHERGELERFQKICTMIIHGELSLNGIKMYSKDKIRLVDLIKRISEIKGRISRLDTEEKVSVLIDSANKFWNEKFVDIIISLIDEKANIVSSELISEAEIVLCNLKDSVKEIKKASETQTELLSKYNAVYYQFMGGYQA